MDARLRQLETAASKGGVEEKSALIGALIRTGQLNHEYVIWCAKIGHQPSQIAVNLTPLDDPFHALRLMMLWFPDSTDPEECSNAELYWVPTQWACLVLQKCMRHYGIKKTDRLYEDLTALYEEPDYDLQREACAERADLRIGFETFGSQKYIIYVAVREGFRANPTLTGMRVFSYLYGNMPVTSIDIITPMLGFFLPKAAI